MIYESQSSSCKERKYRVLFLLDEPITSRDEFKTAHKYVICVFAKNHIGKIKVDLGCYDPSRLFYPANQNEPIDTFKAITKLSDIREALKATDYDQLHEDYKAIQREYLREQEILKLIAEGKTEEAEKLSQKNKKTPKKESKKREKPVIVEDKKTLEEVASDITTFLLDYKTRVELPKEVDLLESKAFIDTLPLTEMFNVGIREKFRCFFHNDSTPSANIIEDGTTQAYYCFSCQETYSAFTLIHMIFNETEGHSLYDTERMVLSLLDVQWGSSYQREVKAQLGANIDLIEGMIEDVVNNEADFLTKHLARDNSLSLLEEINLIASRRCPLNSVTKEDEKYAHVFFSLEYLQKRLVTKGLKGFKCSKRFGQKVRYLCELGLIERIDYREIKDSKLKEIANLNKKTADTVFNNYKNKIQLSEAKSRGLKPFEVKDVYYYRIPFLSQAILNNAVEVINFNKTVGKKKKGNKQKRLEGVNKVLADKIFLQSKVELSKKDKRFLSDAEAFITDVLTNGKGWFILDELLDAIDKNRNYYKNKKAKIDASDDLLPSLVNDLGLEIKRVNKETRHGFNIPESIKSRTMFYCKSK